MDDGLVSLDYVWWIISSKVDIWKMLEILQKKNVTENARIAYMTSGCVVGVYGADRLCNIQMTLAPLFHGPTVRRTHMTELTELQTG